MTRLNRSVPSPALDSQAELAALFEAERAPMVRLATLLVGSVAAAEEVVQDAFASVGERWVDIERPGAYLRTSVVNGCAALLRRRSMQERHRLALPQAENTEMPTRLIEIREALDQLTDRQRIVIVLRYFIDVPDAEIAQILGARQATVRSLARRALSVLRKELE